MREAVSLWRHLILGAWGHNERPSSFVTPCLPIKSSCAPCTPINVLYNALLDNGRLSDQSAAKKELLEDANTGQAVGLTVPRVHTFQWLKGFFLHFPSRRHRSHCLVNAPAEIQSMAMYLHVRNSLATFRWMKLRDFLVHQRGPFVPDNLVQHPFQIE